MTKRIISFLAALVIALSPARASNFGNWGYEWIVPPRAIYRATCVEDVSNITTYNSAAFQAVSTGASDLEDVVILVLVGMEDAAAAFGISSATIEGSAATIIVDQGGTQNVSSAAIRTAGTIKNAATVNISVTATEPLTDMVVCVYALRDFDTATPDSSNTASSATAALMTIVTATTNANGYVFGFCNDGAPGATPTWGVLTQDELGPGTGEMAYTTARAAATGASMSPTCDFTGANETSAVAVAMH